MLSNLIQGRRSLVVASTGVMWLRDTPSLVLLQPRSWEILMRLLLSSITDSWNREPPAKVEFQNSLAAHVRGPGENDRKEARHFYAAMRSMRVAGIPAPGMEPLEHFPYYCELSGFNSVQLFLTEKLRRHPRFGLYL